MTDAGCHGQTNRAVLTIRPAMPSEAGMLTDIACRSEAYWGYDPDFMKQFRSIYQVTEEFINQNPTFVMQEDNEIVAFYGLLLGPEVWLEYFFVEPRHIGKGYGRLLWKHVAEYCREVAIREFRMVTSPQAKEFYVKMGATPLGEVESSLRKGRMIPLLVYCVGG